MGKMSLLGASALRSAAFAGAVALVAATPAFGQAAPAPAPEPVAKAPTCNSSDNANDPNCVGTSEQEIKSGTKASNDSATNQDVVVTGSRIRRPNLESNVPVTSISGEDFFQQAQNNVGDALNDLPQLRSTFAQQNPGAGVGIAGLNLLDLRGLGTSRTLVLVNGRRHVAADILNNAVSPDVNTIPNDLIERVDIVTGGNSAVYGSDAIAGVVNFVLRKDFQGIQLRGQAGVSEAGFGGNQYASIMAGQNFSDNRGNITAHFEYAHSSRVYASDVPWYRRADGFVTVDADNAATPNASDGFPDAIFLRDIRSATINRFGLVVVPQPGTGTTPGAIPAACGYGTLANNGPTNQLGTAYSCNFVFDPAGNLAAQTGTRVGTGPAGTFIGGNGQTSREGTQLSILPRNERYNTNILAHYEFSPAAEFFFEGKYALVKAVGNQLGPTFLNNSTASLGNDNRIDPRLDNPFLSATARTTITNALLANNCGYALGTSISAATCQNLTGANLTARNTAIANGSYRFLFGRNLTDLPDRDEFFKRSTWRIVTGLRGNFWDDFNYEVSVNYGKFKETDHLSGFVNRQRFLLSLDAGRNPATGQIQCRSQFDPTAARGAPGYVNAPGQLQNDINLCVPYNAFGASDNSAAAAYFMLPLTNKSSLGQLDLQGFVGGNLRKLFELPGGPISFVIGGEYRREKARNDSDPAADTGISNAVFLGDVNAPALKVKEAFAELEVPIFKDQPFFHELTLHGAGRVSRYNTGAGTVYTYNGGVDWAPVKDIRFRGNIGRAVRAPNVSEALFPAVPNFANGFIDPCNANAIGGTSARAANCTSQLTAAQLANLQLGGYSLGIISGSNPNLKAEVSRSYTYGVVIQPRYIPGLSVSADYYNIRVKNVISTLSAQTIVNSCYDTPGLTSPLCNVFQRNLSSANGPAGELPGQILNNSLVAGPQNFASRVRRGIDFEVAYRTPLGNNMRLDSRLIYVHGFQSSNFESPTDPTFENRILSELGDPQNEFKFNADVTKGAVTFGYGLHYIGKMYTSTYEAFNSLNGLPPQNADAIEIQQYPAITYHDVRLDIRAAGRGRQELKFTIGVDNILDRKPPFGTTATGAGSAIYAFRGRSYYATVRARF